MFPFTGGARNVRLMREADNGSLRFHGMSDKILAIRQYPVNTSTHIPITGIQYRNLSGAQSGIKITTRKAKRI
jgi:hypothetical protein